MSSGITKRIADTLSRWMAAADNMSKRELAERSKLHVNTIGLLLDPDDKRSPNVETLESVAAAFGKTAAELLAQDIVEVPIGPLVGRFRGSFWHSRLANEYGGPLEPEEDLFLSEAKLSAVLGSSPSDEAIFYLLVSRRLARATKRKKQ